MSATSGLPYHFHVMPMSTRTQGQTAPAYLGYVEAAFTGAGALNLPHLSSPHLLTGTSLYIRNVSGFAVTVTPYSGDTIDGAGTYVLSSGNSLHLLSYPVGNRWKVVCECEIPVFVA